MYASGQSVLLADYVKARLVQDAASDNYHTYAKYQGQPPQA